MQKRNRVLHNPDWTAWIPTLENIKDKDILVFDIETDGLLDDVTKIHCLCMRNLRTGADYSFHGDEVAQGLKLLAAAPIIAGHNIIGYDIPAIKKVYPDWDYEGNAFDTLNACRLIWQDIAERDFIALRKKKLALPKPLIGAHKLEAWGYRLGDRKGEYGKTDGAWERWTPELEDYCRQDVAVTCKLLQKILEANYSPTALALEMAFQEVISAQERSGVCFDIPQAEKLYGELAGVRAEVGAQLSKIVPPQIVEETFTPKVNNASRGYVKGVPTLKRKTIPFNPGSRKQAVAYLTKRYGWEPAEFTKKGEPKLDGEVLSSLPYPEVKLLGHYYDIVKIIGMIAEGKKGWLRFVKPDGRIYGRVTTNGAVTGRCSHSSPNLGQVPKHGEYGSRCRSLFLAPKGWYLVGADASGLELRMLSHYMARYDGGVYAKTVCEGDVHTTNQEAAGLDSRDIAKRFIYAHNYGASDALLGSLKYPDGGIVKQRKAGALMRAKFLQKIPAISKLTDAVQKAVAERKHIKALDGRIVPIKSKHTALNYLLQSAGALSIKYATVIWHEILADKGLKEGVDYIQVLHVHDEVQAYARTEDIAKVVGLSFAEALAEAGKYFKIRCPLTGEYKVGGNWGETH